MSALELKDHWLTNATVPAICLDLIPAGAPTLSDGLVRVDIHVADGKIAAIAKPGSAPVDGPVHDADDGLVWPSFVELHTHLDKGHIWPRRRNPDGTFMGAYTNVAADREANWSPDDVRARMEFSLACAYAHGTKAIRTHVDSLPPQNVRSWPVVREVRERWAGRIELQPVNLVPISFFADRDAGKAMADLVAESGGVLGAVSYIEKEAPALLDRVFLLAAERGLNLDFHIDEGLDPEARSLKAVAEAALRRNFRGKVNCGHCCAFSVQSDEYVETVLGLAADCGLSIVSLPMCNMYLQDRTPGRTPRYRGVTLLQEFKSHDIPVSISSDNTRDPFCGFGDLDMVEVFTQATRIAHLDSDYDGWPAAITSTPASVMGASDAGKIARGATADLVVLRGRSYSEMLSRPQNDRIVLRSGKPIDTAPPDYRMLDAVLGAPAV